MDFDGILEQIGPFGKYQKYLFAFAFISDIYCGLHLIANVYLAATPKYVCSITNDEHRFNVSETDPVSNPSDECFLHSYRRNTTATVSSSPVLDVNSSFHFALYDSDQTIPCDRWEFQPEYDEYTIVMRWGLVCQNSLKASLPSVFVMLGFLLGAISLGNISDRIGRKPVWIFAQIIMCFGGIVAAFMPNYWAHVLVRMLEGIASGGIMCAGFVLSTEMTGQKERKIVGIFFHLGFALGCILLSGLAYFIRDYRYLLLAISLLSIPSYAGFWVTRESARWLMNRNRVDECCEELRNIARRNGRTFPEKLFMDEMISVSKENDIHPVQQSFSDLFRTPGLRISTFLIGYIWFANSFVYYGLSFNVGNLVGSPYLNLFLQGLSEVPALVLGCVLLDRIGRKIPLCAYLGFAGACLIGILFTPQECGSVITSLATLGKFAIAGSFGIIYLYTSEVYPTAIRTTGSGFGSMCARFGALLAPLITELGNLVWTPLPYLVFGTCSCLAAIFMWLLPETLHQTLPETVNDGEEFIRRSSRFFHKKQIAQVKQYQKVNNGVI